MYKKRGKSKFFASFMTKLSRSNWPVLAEDGDEQGCEGSAQPRTKHPEITKATAPLPSSLFPGEESTSTMGETGCVPNWLMDAKGLGPHIRVRGPIRGACEARLRS